MASTDDAAESKSKKRNKKQPTTPTAVRLYPQFTIRDEERLVAMRPAEEIANAVTDAEAKLAALVEPPNPILMENYAIFEKYHPEAIKFRTTDPDAALDPQPLPPAWATAGWPVTTNIGHWRDLFHVWQCTEVDATAEGKAWHAWLAKNSRLAAQLRTARERVAWTAWARVAETAGLALSPAGAKFVDKCVQPVPPRDEERKAQAKRKRKAVETASAPADAKKGTTSLYLPVTTATADETVKFRIRRDRESIYSSDGMALVFHSDAGMCGVIYPAAPTTFWSTATFAAPAELARMRDLLAGNVAGIYAQIGDDPGLYFSSAGKRCGMCMFCGRDLSDEDSKARGYGAVCGVNAGLEK